MKLITVGSSSDIKLHIRRFLELNDYDLDMDTDDSERLFYEMVHIAYAVKVIIRFVCNMI